MTEPDADHTDGALTTEQDRPTQLGDEADLDEFRTTATVALVEFYTNGCGICQSMEPVLGAVARTLDVDVGLINPRDDPPLIERFDVTGVPLLVLFVDGEPAARREDGFVSADELTAWIQEATDRQV